MKLNETLQICLLAIASRYPDSTLYQFAVCAIIRKRRRDSIQKRRDYGKDHPCSRSLIG